MRPLLVALALSVAGCANTVYRIEGDAFTPEGPARTACEKRDFLVLAPTRAEIAAPGESVSRPRDGSGIYDVGGKDPQSIIELEDDGPSPIVERKQKELEPYERSKYIATGLGAAGIVAIGIGTVLFISAFETQTTFESGRREEEQTINGGKAAAGGIVVGAGFGLGIAGLIVNPSHAERTRANASRYVFLSPEDNPKEVQRLVTRHNVAVRRRCEATGGGDDY